MDDGKVAASRGALSKAVKDVSVRICRPLTRNANRKFRPAGWVLTGEGVWDGLSGMACPEAVLGLPSAQSEDG